MQQIRRQFGIRSLALAAGALIAALFAPLAAIGEEPAPGAAPREAVLLKLDGPVTPANAQYLAREIAAASDAKKELIVIEIDTPGGLVDSMKTIIKAILASQTPVATFVSPQGARSASAGLYIMYAAHVSAMAPNTNTGAATPIELGGSGGDDPFKDEKPDAAPSPGAPQGEPQAGDTSAPAPQAMPETAPEGIPEITPETTPPLSNSDAMRAKVINDSVAYIRSLADEHGRNADWAEKAVREAASVTSREALSLGVIDLIANDLDDLMTQLDGRTVKTVAGEKVLQTAGLKPVPVEPTLIETVLGFIANPNVAVILMSLATTGIIIEMWNPGSIFPGAVGALCLLLGLYSLQVLPYNALPLAMIGVGAVLMAVEAYTPTFGLAGLAGLALFGFSLYFLFPDEFRVSREVIGAIVIIAGAFLALILFAVVGSRSHGPMIGAEAIRRREGVVDDWHGREGWVIVEGERWRARADKPLQKGEKVKVVEIDGLVLVVRQAKALSLLDAFAPRAA